MTRLVTAFKTAGPPGLVSKRRGKPSNRAFSASIRTNALALVRSEYADFGPLLAAEKLLERHDIKLSSETLRRWMIDDGL